MSSACSGNDFIMDQIDANDKLVLCHLFRSIYVTLGQLPGAERHTAGRPDVKISYTRCPAVDV